MQGEREEKNWVALFFSLVFLGIDDNTKIHSPVIARFAFRAFTSHVIWPALCALFIPCSTWSF
jgi:hypothetical protein